MAAGLEDAWLAGDPLDEPLTVAEMLAGTPRPAKGYVLCPLAWLARVLPIVRTADRLAVVLLLYSRCRVRRSRTVDLPNGELTKLGIERKTKYRTLRLLEEAGALTIEARNGRSIRVTLHWFPGVPDVHVLATRKAS
jgi:hypothetical protein